MIEVAEDLRNSQKMAYKVCHATKSSSFLKKKKKSYPKPTELNK